jgi:tartrate-resistant acid phosphatase type 5
MIEPIKQLLLIKWVFMVGEWMLSLLWRWEVVYYYLFQHFSHYIADNFYENGIANVTDPQWDVSFHDVYSAASLDIPWYPILGNHDYHVDPTPQIERSFEEDETMWTFPSRYYVYNYTLSDGAIVSVVNIDTQLIDTDHDDTSFVYEDKNWRRTRSNHLTWIDETLLEQSKYATWLVVTGHYPIYSVGVNGDNSVLLKYLSPILTKHKVHMYIAGHDHNNQYATMNDGICYVVCGQGAGRGPFGAEGVKFYGISASSPFQKFFISESGFAYGEVDSSTFNVTFVDVHGNKRYTGVLTNPYTSDYRESVRASVTSGHESGSSGSGETHHYHMATEDEGFYMGVAIVVPGVLMTVALLMYVFREAPEVQFVLTVAKQGRDELKQLALSLKADILNEERIRPEIDVSTRSDVGFTADMDRSGRRQNLAPRQSQSRPGSLTLDSAAPVIKGKYSVPSTSAPSPSISTLPPASDDLDDVKV